MRPYGAGECREAVQTARPTVRYSVYLLFWYKRTNTDAVAWHFGRGGEEDPAAAGQLLVYEALSYGLKLLVYEALSYISAGAARKIQQLCAVSGMSSKMSDAEILAKVYAALTC